VQARLGFTLSLSDLRVSSNGSRRLPALNGHTLDVSVTGLALIVPAIRIGEHYLAGSDRTLHVRLELPNGPIEMKVATVRYESLEDDTGYLIGARILEMSDSDRASFEKYVANVMKHQPAV
jgi:hypothetical protein